MGAKSIFIPARVLFSLFLAGFLGGVILGNSVEDFLLGVMLEGLLFLIIGVTCMYMPKLKYYGLSILVGSILGLCLSSYTLSAQNNISSGLERYEGLYINYSGEVHSLHKRSDFYDEYIMNLATIGEQVIDNQNIYHILRVPKNFSLDPGQRANYSGVVYRFQDFDGFAYEKYMLSKNIYFSSSTTNLDIIDSPNSGLNYSLYVFRERLLERIAQIFPQKEAIFLGGILFGARENIPDELKEDFNNSGLTHFIAVSGFNITLCIIFMTFLFGFLPPAFRGILVITCITLFSFFVGLGAPVVRAAIMGGLAYIFLQSGNKAQSLTLILFTASLMSVYSPLSLSYDVSLHLSFLAVIGIVYTQEFFTKIFSWVPSVFAIREAFVLTLAALSFALPIMVFQFGQVSLLAPLANIAVTWTIPLAMLLGALTLIVDFIFPLGGYVLGFFTWLLLKYDMIMVELFGNSQWALMQFDFGEHGIYLQAIYFIVFSYIVALFRIRSTRVSTLTR